MKLPPYPFLNRCLFKLFPYFMNKYFPPQIDPDDSYVEVPEEIADIEFEKPWHKRALRKRFPDCFEQYPKIPPKYKGWIPDDPLPGEFESPIWRIEKFIAELRFKVHCRRMDRKKKRKLAPPKEVYFPFYSSPEIIA